MKDLPDDIHSFIEEYFGWFQLDNLAASSTNAVDPLDVAVDAIMAKMGVEDPNLSERLTGAFGPGRRQFVRGALQSLRCERAGEARWSGNASLRSLVGSSLLGSRDLGDARPALFSSAR